MAYRLASEAGADLREIDDFVARRKNNPRGAGVVEKYLFEAFERIGASPARCGGKSRPEVTRKPVKFLTVRKYVVIYDDRNDPVIILGIAGAKQNLPRVPRNRRYPHT